MECLSKLLRLLLLSVSVLQLACGKRYEIRHPWEINFDPAKLGRLTSPIDDAAGYMVLSNGVNEIVSENGTYALASLVHISNVSSSSRESGLAKGGPLGFAVVMRKKAGSKVDGTPVWRGAWPLEMSFTSVHLDETGGLMLYCNRSLVWKSFDHPGDTLLPGQRLKHGMVLRNGDYTAQVARSGLALYANNSPYHVWNVKTSEESTISSIDNILCEGYGAVVLYTGSELQLLYEASSKLSVNHSCDIPPPLTLMRVRASDNVMPPYLQLDSTGDLIIFKRDSVSGSWTPASKLSDNVHSCKLPSVCEANRLYDSKKRKCLSFSSHGAARTLNFSRLEGVSHFATRFLTPVKTAASIEDCAVSFASLNVLVYDNNLRSCFRISGPGDENVGGASGFYCDDTTQGMTTLINLSVSQIDRGKETSRRAVILVWFVGSVAALWFLTIPTFLTIEYEVPAMVKQNLRASGAILMRSTTHFNKGVREMELSLLTMPDRPRRFTYKELDSATKGFREKLGAGGFGSVYKGMTLDGKPVAVKKLAKCNQATKQLVTEVLGIGGIKHSNVVKLHGFCLAGASNRLLVYDFMSNGSLDRWIFGGNEGRTLSWSQRLEIALGTARGLCYLHEECSKPVLHLDVKPQNILLDENFVPKLSDFGMAKMLENQDITQESLAARGTLAYMAPEWLMEGRATKKCDIYSYGLVLLELIGGRRNTEWNRVEQGDENDVDSSWYFPSWAVEQVRKGNLIEICDEKVRHFAASNRSHTASIVRLALWCIQLNPSLRPPFPDIVEILEGRRSVVDPPMSFHFKFRSEPDAGRSSDRT